MSKEDKKEYPSAEVFRRQIERTAAAYTDSRIDEVLKTLQDLTEDGASSGANPTPPTDPPGGGKPPKPPGGGGKPKDPWGPDAPTPWIIPRPPVRDISAIGTVDSITFQKADDSFTYEENSQYGELYLSADGSLVATVTVKIEGTGEIEDFELQVTKIEV